MIESIKMEKVQNGWVLTKITMDQEKTNYVTNYVASSTEKALELARKLLVREIADDRAKESKKS